MDQHSLIEGIHAASIDVLDCFARGLIQERLPTDYLQTLGDIDRTNALCASLIVLGLTVTIIVRTFRLKAVLAILNGQDNVITAGTCRNINHSRLVYIFIPWLHELDLFAERFNHVKPRHNIHKILLHRRHGPNDIFYHAEQYDSRDF